MLRVLRCYGLLSVTVAVAIVWGCEPKPPIAQPSPPPPDYRPSTPLTGLRGPTGGGVYQGDGWEIVTPPSPPPGVPAVHHQGNAWQLNQHKATWETWSLVKIGMTGQQVRRILGAPTGGAGDADGPSFNTWRVVDRSRGFDEDVAFAVHFQDSRVTLKYVTRERAQPRRPSTATVPQPVPLPSPAPVPQPEPQPCWACDGHGVIACDFCTGGWTVCDFCSAGVVQCDFCTNGYVSCEFCGGKDRWNKYSYARCIMCNGKGSYTCPICKGQQQYTCPICKGNCKYRCAMCKGNLSYRCPVCKGSG